MFEHLAQTLPPSALACRALYDVPTGGYRIPLRADNMPMDPQDVDAIRERHPQLQYDCVEVPVADLLYSLVVNTHSRLILETGTSRGFSTCHLAAGACFDDRESAARVISVDLEPAPCPFFAGSGMAAFIRPIRADSLKLAPASIGSSPFDFMFFDSLHTYAHLSAELARYLPLLKLGGLFALHDTFVYDDLGLVVLAMMQRPCVEVVSLPTHRRHAGPARRPGLTLFRKVARIRPGELVFPNLADLVTGERQSLQLPQQVVERTGSLFTDPRYAAHDLQRHGGRSETSPALLDVRGSDRHKSHAASSSAPPQPQRQAAVMGALPEATGAPGADDARPSSSRTRATTASDSLRKEEEAWWRTFGDLQDPLNAAIPDALVCPSRRRWIDRVARHLHESRLIVDIGCGNGWLTRELRTRVPATVTGVDFAHRLQAKTMPDGKLLGSFDDLPVADGYVIHGALHHCCEDELQALLQSVATHALPGARVAVVEPVCFPGHAPDAHGRALTGAIEEILAGLRAQVAGIEAPQGEQARGRLATRWWGRLPNGPSPLEKPFEHDELAPWLARVFAPQHESIVQCIAASEQLAQELAVLHLDQPALAESLAEQLHPRMDAIERGLLRLPRLPDTSWYVRMSLGRTRQPA